MSAVKTPCSQPHVHRRSWAPKPSGKRKAVLESLVSEAAHAADHFGGPLPWLGFSSHGGASLWTRLSECVKVLLSAALENSSTHFFYPGCDSSAVKHGKSRLIKGHYLHFYTARTGGQQQSSLGSNPSLGGL